MTSIDQIVQECENAIEAMADVLGPETARAVMISILNAIHDHDNFTNIPDNVNWEAVCYAGDPGEELYRQCKRQQVGH